MQDSHPIVRGYQLFDRGANNLQSFTLLVFRLAFGWKMFLSGHRHLNDVAAMVQRFTDWGIPFPKFNVYMSGSTEMIGGALLMAGLATRLISIPLIVNFIVAIVTAGVDSVRQLIDGGQILPAKDYSAGRLSGLEAVTDDTAFPFLLACLLLLAFGAGKVSLDYLLKQTMFGKATSGKPASSA
jgi:putative oxidoreductase